MTMTRAEMLAKLEAIIKDDDRIRAEFVPGFYTSQQLSNIQPCLREDYRSLIESVIDSLRADVEAVKCWCVKKNVTEVMCIKYGCQNFKQCNVEDKDHA